MAGSVTLVLRRHPVQEGSIVAVNEGSDRRGRGPADPARAARIAEAACAVVAQRGVGGVTHRAVAAAAGVPLGSTTYHFATLDDLLAVALASAAEQNIARLRRWERSLTAGTGLAAALADLVLREVATNRAQTVVEYELYVAALHRPRLRQASTAWDNAMVEIFASRTDLVTGRLLAATFCRLVLQALLAEHPPTRQDVEAIFRRAL